MRGESLLEGTFPSKLRIARGPLLDIVLGRNAHVWFSSYAYMFVGRTLLLRYEFMKFRKTRSISEAV